MASNDALSASFGFDIAPLQQSLKRAGDHLKTFVAGFVSFEAAKKVIESLNQSLEMGSHLEDLSIKTGIASGALYDMGIAGKKSGLELEDITTAVNKMQRSLGAGANASLLHSLGLDPQTLASAKPEEAFYKIGTAINALPNATERTIAAMQLFGKAGAAMLQLFAAPEFKGSFGTSETAQMIEKNGAIFKKFSDSLGQVGPKLSAFFTGFNSENASNLERMANAIDHLDLASSGANAGTVVATFTEAFAEDKLGDLLWLSMKIAVEKFVNSMVGGVLTMGLALQNFLMSLINTFNAGLMHGLGLLIDTLSNTPFLGKYFKGMSDEINKIGDQFALTAVNQSSKMTDMSAGMKMGTIFDTSNDENNLDALTESIHKGLQISNAGARINASDTEKRANAAFNLGDIGKGTFGIVADSLAKIGGGGNAQIGGTSENPLLAETRKQTLLAQKSSQTLQQILIQAQRSPVQSLMAPATFSYQS